MVLMIFFSCEFWKLSFKFCTYHCFYLIANKARKLKVADSNLIIDNIIFPALSLFPPPPSLSLSLSLCLSVCLSLSLSVSLSLSLCISLPLSPIGVSFFLFLVHISSLSPYLSLSRSLLKSLFDVADQLLLCGVISSITLINAEI